jgi:hypothetical protein
MEEEEEEEEEEEVNDDHQAEINFRREQTDAKAGSSGTQFLPDVCCK